MYICRVLLTSNPKKLWKMTKVVRYCLFKKRIDEPECTHYCTRIWTESPFGTDSRMKATWSIAHVVNSLGVPAPIGPPIEGELAEKLEAEFQAWVKKVQKIK